MASLRGPMGQRGPGAGRQDEGRQAQAADEAEAAMSTSGACARRGRWAGARDACARACRARRGRSRRPASTAGRRPGARRQFADRRGAQTARRPARACSRVACWRTSVARVLRGPSSMKSGCANWAEHLAHGGREAHRLAQVARPVGRVGGFGGASSTRPVSVERMVQAAVRFSVTSRTSASKGATAAAIMAEWKACEVWSSLGDDALGFERARCSWSMASLGPAATQAAGPLSAASEVAFGQVAARARRLRSRTDSMMPAGSACINAPRRHQARRVVQATSRWPARRAANSPTLWPIIAAGLHAQAPACGVPARLEREGGGLRDRGRRQRVRRLSEDMRLAQARRAARRSKACEAVVECGAEDLVVARTACGPCRRTARLGRGTARPVVRRRRATAPLTL